MRFSTASVVLIGLLPSVVVRAASIPPVARATNDDPCAEFAATRGSKVTGLDAKLFLRCIKNIPFNSDKASETIANLRIFFGLDTLAQYYIDPPTSELELQPFNLNKTLSKIDSNIKNNAYDSNWAFDYDVVKMFQLFRDGHTDYEPLCTHGYIYVHDYPIISVASDNGGLPEIYAVEKDFGATQWQKPKLGSKIKKINGKSPQDYMKDFIRNSPEALDWVDPDARYNEMLYGYPEGIARGRFARRNMWNGEDIRITWENGTDTLVEFTLQLTTDIYKNGELLFKDTKSLAELCFLSDEELSSGSAKKRETEVERRNLIEGVMERDTADDKYLPNGYPTALAYSKEYAMATYSVLGDKETIVLNIRSFDEQALEPTAFVQAMVSFVKEQVASWKKSGYKRLIIDVSGNRGGKAILPFEILKQLFPKDEEFLNLNMHWSPITWAYMHSINNGSEYEMYRDTNMKDFKDMADFLGPVQKDGGYYSKIWKQDYVQFGKDNYDITVTSSGEQPFAPENIVVISNSLCASACHSLVESLRAQNVRAFAYGGRAVKSSPMQPVGGTKGGKVLTYDAVQASLKTVANDKTVIAAAGEPDTWLLKPLPVRTKEAKVNTENKFRDGNNLPLQFVYTPACNRFFMNEPMLTDITEVWKKTRAVAWDGDGKATKCVNYTPIDNQDKFLESSSGSGGNSKSGGYSIGHIIWEHMRGGN